jgi:LysR family glycine cleavage system transcriptional activator
VSELLFQDEIEPVCSPRYLDQHAPGRQKPETLLAQRLLVSHYRRSDWDDWLTAAGLAARAAEAERMTFSSSVLTWQAALDGLGVAIGQKGLLLSELQSGQLIRPFAKPLRRSLGHYLVRPQVQRESRKVNSFRDWLLESAASTAAAAAEL